MSFFNDNFTTTSTTPLTSHTSDSGATWSLVKGTVVPKVFNVLNGVLASGGSSADTTTICIPSVIAPSPDVNVVATTYYDSANFNYLGVTARTGADGNSGYIACYARVAGVWALFRIGSGNPILGSALAVSSAVSYSSGAAPIMDFSVSGTGATVTLVLKVNGVEVINFADTDAARKTTAGYTGIMIVVNSGEGQGMYLQDMASSELTTNVSVSSNLQSQSSITANLHLPDVFGSNLQSQSTVTAAMNVAVRMVSSISTQSSLTSTLSVLGVFNYLPNSYNYADRVKETSSSIGTSSFSLSGAVTGHRSFSSIFSNGTKRIPYCIEDTTTGAWEIGLGTITTNSLTRDEVFSSSNGNSLVNFSAGVKNVFCTLPANPIAKFSTKDYIDLRDYNVDPSFGTDSTAGIQAAINDAYNLDIPVIKIPAGRYKIAGPLATSNAQLYIPNTRYNAAKQKSIRFVGACVPNLEAQGLITIPPTLNGVIFESTIIGTANSSLLRGEAPSQSDSAPWNWNNTNVGFENMCFRTKADTQANPMSALNLDYFSQIIVLDNLRIDTNAPLLGSFDPSSVNSTGLRMPPINNHAQFNIGTILVTGYTNGVVLEEHGVAKSLLTLGCTNGLVLGDAFHGSYIGHLLVECSKNSIKTNGKHPLFIGTYSTEHNQDGNWFDFTSDLNLGASPGTRKVVIGSSTVVKSHVGVDDTAWTTNATSANYKIIAGAGAN